MGKRKWKRVWTKCISCGEQFDTEGDAREICLKSASIIRREKKWLMQITNF